MFYPQSICFMTKAAITAACGKRRKRRAITDLEPNQFADDVLPNLSFVSTSSKEEEEVQEVSYDLQPFVFFISLLRFCFSTLYCRMLVTSNIPAKASSSSTG